MMEKLWMVAIISFGLYWISPFITIFACEIVNATNWFIFHEDAKRSIGA